MKNEKRGPGFDKPQSPPTLKMGNTYFLGIGINKYQDFTELNNAVKDVTDVGNVLTNRFGFNPKKPYFHLLTDTKATRENIIQALNDLVDKVQPEDRVLIYYSGHGYLRKSTNLGYWLSVDAKNGRIGTYVTNSDVRDIIKAMNCRHILLISDSCFSEKLLTRSVDKGEANTRAYYDWERKKSRWIISSGKGEVPDGEPGKNSPFAEQLLYHLNDVERQINVNGLADKVIKTIQYDYEQQPEASSLYGAGHKGGQFIFYRTGVNPELPEQESTNSSQTKSGKANNEETTATPQAVSIENSKNVLSGNVINVTGDLHIGDKTTNTENTDAINDIKNTTTTSNNKKMPAAPQNLAELKEQLNELVEEDELKAALQLFKKHLHPDSGKSNDLVLLTSRFNSTMKDIKRMIVTREQAKMDFARIKYSLTSYIEGLDEEDVQFFSEDTKVEDTVSKSNASAKLSLLEQEGLIEQAELLTKRINLIRRKLAIETDPSSQFKYEEEIKEFEKKLAAIKEKL